MTAALVPAKTQVVNNNFVVTKPKWNRTTTTTNHQQPSNVSKILVFATPRKSIDLGEKVNVSNTKDSIDNNNSTSKNSNQSEWTAEKKSVFPVS